MFRIRGQPGSEAVAEATAASAPKFPIVPGTAGPSQLPVPGLASTLSRGLGRSGIPMPVLGLVHEELVFVKERSSVRR